MKISIVDTGIFFLFFFKYRKRFEKGQVVAVDFINILLRTMFSPTSWFLRVLTVATALLTVGAQTADTAGYHDLMTSLFKNYSRDIRPVRDITTTTWLFMTVQLLSILEVNEKEQTLKTNILLSIYWDDEYMIWNPKNYSYIWYIQMRQKKMWIPDIIVDNTVSPEAEFGYDNLKLRVLYVGLVLWSPSAIIETSCDIDITYYPFDTQMCELVFKTSISTEDEIYVEINKTIPFDLSRYSPNGLWTLLNMSAENGKTGDFYQPYIKFKLQLQRRRSFYILNIVIPICLLSLTAALVFALPSDSGEKMGLSVTILLAYAVYLTIITDSMPKTSLQVSVLTLYLILLLAVTATSVILSVFMLRLHHRPDTSPLIGHLASVTMIVRTLLRMDKPNQPEEEICQEEQPVGNCEDRPADRTVRHSKNAVSDVWATSCQTGSRVTSARALTPHSKRLALSGRLVAETWDKFFFILFSSISVGSTISCLLALLVGAKLQEDQTSLA